MKLPRYLIIALLITGAIVLWSQFSNQEEEEGANLINAPTNRVRKPPTPPLTPSDEVIDLFPLPARPEANVEKKEMPPPPPPPAVEEFAPPFPLKVMGAWWSDGDRILILNNPNENVNRFLCRKCQIKGSIKPDEMITPEWKLVTLEKDHLSVEWLPKHLIKHVELGDLQSEPTRNTVN